VNFPGLETHWERLGWPVEDLDLNEEFAVGLNGPCKNASGHVWTLLHAYTGHSKLTQLLNTIPTIFMIIGKNPYRSDLNTVRAASAASPERRAR
jgi:hypothetical protein